MEKYPLKGVNPANLICDVGHITESSDVARIMGMSADGRAFYGQCFVEVNGYPCFKDLRKPN